MKRRLVIAASLLTATVGVQASEGVDWNARAKSAGAAAAAPLAAPAPFRARARDPLPELMLRDEQERRGPRGACEQSASDVCYDLADRRVVYRPARQYMPRIEGLTPEAISLRHDRLILKYSFR